MNKPLLLTMPRNVEVKARVAAADLKRILGVLREQCAGAEPQRFTQRDVFFGRLSHADEYLKLRTQRRIDDAPHGALSARLIHYRRRTTTDARASVFSIADIGAGTDLGELERVLGAANGCIGVVNKWRDLLMVGRTRVHIDCVDNLGLFLELEVQLRDDESEADGAAVADELMRALGIADEQRVAVPYVELLRPPTTQPPAE